MVFLKGKLEVEVIGAINLPNADFNKKKPNNKSDPYVIVKVSDGKKKETKIGVTPTIDDCLNPKWNCNLNHDVNQEVREIIFEVKDDDRFKDDKLGVCTVPVEAFHSPEGYTGVLDLLDKKRERAGQLHVRVNFLGPYSG